MYLPAAWKFADNKATINRLIYSSRHPTMTDGMLIYLVHDLDYHDLLIVHTKNS